MEAMIRADQLFARSAPETATLDRPLDHLVACHGRIEERLQMLERAALHMADRTAEALQACHAAFKFLDTSGVLHTEDEEQSVFPRIRPQATDAERAYLASLEAQHHTVEERLERLRGLTAQLESDAGKPAREAFAQTVAELAGLYRAHIASENEALTAIGRARLDAPALAEIAAEMRQRRAR